MDPVTAALNLATEIVRLINVTYSSMSDEQKKETMQWHLNNLAFFQKLFGKVNV